MEPSFEKLIALSKCVDVSSDYLLGVSDSIPPYSGEVLDKDIVDFFNSYQQLRGTSSAEIRKYMDYLLYLQSKESGERLKTIHYLKFIRDSLCSINVCILRLSGLCMKLYAFLYLFSMTLLLAECKIITSFTEFICTVNVYSVNTGNVRAIF